MAIVSRSPERSDSEMQGAAGEPGTVLVVDDDPANLRLLSDVLRGAGYRVRAAIGGREALSSAQMEAPDLILLDVAMPEMDGYEVCRRLKEDDRTRHVSILFISAKEDVSDKVRAFRAGGVDYVTKPFQADEVLARVGTHVRLRRLQLQLERHNLELEETVRARTADIETANRELAERERLYRLLADNVRDVIWVFDPDLQPTYYSPSVKAQRGYSVDEALRLPLESLLTPASYNEVMEVFDELRRSRAPSGGGQGRVLELEVRRKGGTTFWAEAHISPLLAEDGTFQGFIGVTRDISKRKSAEAEREKLERQLFRTQRLEAIGTLAGGIAHDFNNLLSGIIGYTRMTLDDMPGDWAHRDDLERVLRAGKRATDLVDQILAFSRQVKGEKRSFEPRIIVNEALKLLRATLPKTIELRKNLEAGALVFGDPSGIDQVVMNLCTNAALAIGDAEGVIDVSLTEVELDADAVRFIPGVRPGPHVRLQVRDTGAGIAPEHVDRIFEPFFTTREEGKGTGMGLAVVHGIVVGHGGGITVNSTPGKGTRFDVYFPRLVGAHQSTRESQEAFPPGGTERVLLVDDEEDLTALGKRMLERLGYRVTVASSGVEALAAFQREPDAYDVVITDMTMPKMTGDVLARKLRPLRPDLPIILCSGYGDEGVEARAAAAGIEAIVRKPLLVENLAPRIREVLEGREGTK